MNKENKMGSMPINKLLITMSLPMIISMLVQALYNIVDSYYVAKISEEAFTAVSLAYPLQNLMIAFAAGTAVGMNSLLSRCLGEKNQKHVNDTAMNGIFIYVLTAIAFMILGITFSHTFFKIQVSDPTILAYGTTYSIIVLGLSFGLFGQFYVEKALQATGRTVLSMVIQLIGAIINIILDPILIFGYFGLPAMGIAGAAYATVIGQIISFIIGIFINIKLNHDIQLNFKDFKPNLAIIKRIYAVGIPSIVMSSIGSIMTFGMNKILIAFSNTATAVFGAYFKLQSFIFMPVIGINNGIIPIVAYNYGAKQKDRVHQALKYGRIYASILMILGCLIFELFPEQLLSLFEASDYMLSIGIPALRIIGIHFVLAGYAIVTSGLFQALGKGTYSLIVSLIRQLLVLLPVAYLLSLLGNLNLIWIAFPIAEVASLITTTILCKRIYKKIGL